MIRVISGFIFIVVIIGCDKPEVESFTLIDEIREYKKIDRYGDVMDDKAGPWYCILDKKAGLLWENKTEDHGVHHFDWTYTFYAADQSRNERESLIRDGSCESSNKGACTTLSLIKRTNQERLCGGNAWRLPTQSELERLIDTSREEQLPLITTGIFPYTKNSSYWTSTKDSKDEKIFAVNFMDGSGGYYPRKGAFYVRLVSDWGLKEENHP